MEKDKFLFLLSQSASLTEDETKELAKLQDEFPYSQAIHNLVARGAQLNELENKQSFLTKAAVYATDRAVLKAIVTALPGPRKEKFEEKKQQAQPPKPITTTEVKAPVEPNLQTADKKEVSEKPAVPAISKTEPKKELKKSEPIPVFKGSKLSGDALIDELFHDLDKLKKLKHDFEVAIDQFDTSPTTRTDYEQSVEEKPEQAPEKKKNKAKEPSEGLIAEIKSSKKKIKPSDPRQKEQLDIINQFIKSEPTIGKNKGTPTSADATDLAESSSTFSENIVSETLVEILIKQGKKEKAVEVLRKLIWKFPQKKAYFAAQIEELTK